MVRKAVQVAIEHGKQLRFQDGDSTKAPASSEAPPPDALGKTFRAYLDALKQLLATRYSHAADAVPAYMKGPCQVTVLRCTDALFVRYDLVEQDDTAKVRIVDTAQPVEAVAPVFSDAVVHAPSDLTNWSPSAEGPKLSMFIHDPTGVATREVMSFSPMMSFRRSGPRGCRIPRHRADRRRLFLC
jgi:hypothetical protein